MQALNKIGRPEDIAGHRGKVVLQDMEGGLDCAKCEDVQHAIQIKWRKVSNGKCSEETQHLF